MFIMVQSLLNLAHVIMCCLTGFLNSWIIHSWEWVVQTQDEFSFQAPNSKDSVSMLGFTKGGEMTFVEKKLQKSVWICGVFNDKGLFYICTYVYIYTYLLMNRGDASCGWCTNETLAGHGCSVFLVLQVSRVQEPKQKGIKELFKTLVGMCSMFHQKCIDIPRP